MMWWNKFREPPPLLRFRFKPDQTITPYELAFILSKTMAQPVVFTVQAWDETAPEIQRHFQP